MFQNRACDFRDEDNSPALIIHLIHCLIYNPLRLLQLPMLEVGIVTEQAKEELMMMEAIKNQFVRIAKSFRGTN